MTRKNQIVIALFALACFVAGIVLYVVVFAPQPTQTASTSKPVSMVDQRRPDFTLLDTSDKKHDIAEWDGKVILLNFWATWCPPCRHEIPAFIDTYNKFHDKGLMIVGVALDSKQNAIDFVDPMGINYPILVAEQTGIGLTQEYGNHLGVLPYSVIIDRKGVIRHTISHELTQQQAEQLITPLL